MTFYSNPVRAGTDAVKSLGDGYTINVTWFQAEHSNPANKIAYQIYYSTEKTNVFFEGPKYISIDGSLQANLTSLTPGLDYYVAVRPVEYNPNNFVLTELPIAYDNLRIYPTSILRSDISSTDLIIPLLDVEGFPSTGIIEVGVELIQYSFIDTPNNNLIVAPSGSDTPVQLVYQPIPDGYFSAYDSNTGDGYLINLTAIDNSGAPTEDYNIICSLVQRDGYGQPIPGTAKFTARGAISGPVLDGYGEPIIWSASGSIVSNGVLSFAIVDGDGYAFVEGDGFLVKIAGAESGTPGGRGYGNLNARSHTVDGYDGYTVWDPTIRLFVPGEDSRWDRIFVCQSRFEYPNYPYTITDGYHQVTKDILSTDLSAADAANEGFPPYDYSGYHRTDPVQLLNGTCVGSYIGGEMGCIDKYGNYNIMRGFSLQDQNTQRQEVLLSVDGRPAVLVQRVRTGITCSCYLPSSQYPDDRCPMCYGTKFVFGYEQYFNPRRSDGRILVRPGPIEENLKMYDAGMESEFPLDLWTLTVPTIKTRDVIVLFDQDNNEEFRYEVAGVTRNNTILGQQGGQKMKTFRIRKTDPAYQIRVLRDSSMFPSKLSTSISFVPGIPPHTHEIVINEKITSVNQINQTTAISQGHNHPIVNGQVMEALGHKHIIILP